MGSEDMKAGERPRRFPGKLVQRVRVASGMTYAAMAGELGTQLATVMRWKSHGMTLEALVLLARFTVQQEGNKGKRDGAARLNPLVSVLTDIAAHIERELGPGFEVYVK